MKASAYLRLFLLSTAALLCLSGCPEHSPYTNVSFVKFAALSPVPSGVRADPSAAAVVHKDTRLALTAKRETILDVYNIENPSTGTFKAQVRVAFARTKGLRSGQSMAFIRLNEAGSDSFYTMGARYLEVAGGGFFAFPTLADGSFGVPMNYSGQHEVELQIEQNETTLIFSSRLPVDLGGNGVWHVQDSVARSPENQCYVSIGLLNVDKGAVFYYSDFRLSGAGIGGAVEGGINLQLEDALDAIRSAQAKLKLKPADLTGAATDLETAVTAGTNAATALQDALANATLQDTTFGQRAAVFLNAAIKKLKATQTIVAKHKPSQIRGAANGLSGVDGNVEAAIGNLLGLKVNSLKSTPPIFTWHTD